MYDAIKLMAEKNTGALLVTEGERLVGLISERDYARKLILEGRSSRDTPVRDVMTIRVAYADSSDTVEHCMALMTEKRFGHLPVMKEDQLLGMVSIGDLVKALIEEQKFQIQQVERYITGQ